MCFKPSRIDLDHIVTRGMHIGSASTSVADSSSSSMRTSAGEMSTSTCMSSVDSIVSSGKSMTIVMIRIDDSSISVLLAISSLIVSLSISSRCKVPVCVMMEKVQIDWDEGNWCVSLRGKMLSWLDNKVQEIKETSQCTFRRNQYKAAARMAPRVGPTHCRISKK